MAAQGHSEADPLLDARGAAGTASMVPPRVLPAESSAKQGPAGEGPGAGELKVPRTILFIIGNEFCERFSYYGMRAILALYLNEQLQLSEGASTEIVHLFIVFCYLFPFLGAFISDSYWGKYRVILSLSIVYCIGNWLVSLSAVVAPSSVNAGLAWAFLGLLFIALGSGGIKPCVSSFGGDQIELTNPPGPARDRLLRSFFSYFYFAINVGSCFSMILVPILRANVSYFSAFAAPAVLMMVALAIFYMGRKGYVHQPPSGNVVAEVLAIIWYALGPPREGLPVSSAPPPPGTRSGPSAATGQGGGEGSGQHVPGQSSGTPQGSGKGPLASEGAEEPLEVKRLLKRGSKRAVLPQGAVAAPHWLDCSKPRFGAEKVEDVKQVLRVLLLFLPTPIFWSLWDQQASRWVFQASRMDGTLPFGLTVYPDQMQTINALGILAMIPLFDQVLYPLAERVGIPVKPIRRMALGMVFGALSFVMSAVVEVWIQQCPVVHGSSALPGGGALGLGGEDLTGAAQGGGSALALPSARSLLLGAQSLRPSLGLGAGDAPATREACINMMWQVPQYMLVTAGEILFSITGLELAYSQAPSSMTAVVSAAWLVTDATGNLFTILVIGSISPLLTQVQEFLFFAAMCTVATLLLLWVGKGFTYVESVDDARGEGA